MNCNECNEYCQPTISDLKKQLQAADALAKVSKDFAGDLNSDVKCERWHIAIANYEKARGMR